MRVLGGVRELGEAGACGDRRRGDLFVSVKTFFAVTLFALKVVVAGEGPVDPRGDGCH